MTIDVESESGDESYVNELIVGEGLAHELHDAKSAFREVVRASIATELHSHRVQDFRQEDCLSLGHEIVDELMRVDLIRQGVLSHDGLGLLEVWFQTVNDRQ